MFETDAVDNCCAAAAFFIPGPSVAYNKLSLVIAREVVQSLASENRRDKYPPNLEKGRRVAKPLQGRKVPRTDHRHWFSGAWNCLKIAKRPVLESRLFGYLP